MDTWLASVWGGVRFGLPARRAGFGLAARRPCCSSMQRSTKVRVNGRIIPWNIPANALTGVVVRATCTGLLEAVTHPFCAGSTGKATSLPVC